MASQAKAKKKGFFITGTDTDAGKTSITAALLVLLRQQGVKTAILKPLAAGCAETADGLRNADVVMLQQEATLQLAYQHANPFAFALPSAPHILAAKLGAEMHLPAVYAACQPALLCAADYLLVEGVGGWAVPINAQETMADLARELALPVILVVGMRVGCFNHALLTVRAIQQSGLPLAGWVANTLDPNMLCLTEYIVSLQQHIAAPLLGIVPRLEKFSAATVAGHLNLSSLANFW